MAEKHFTQVDTDDFENLAIAMEAVVETIGFLAPRVCEAHPSERVGLSWTLSVLRDYLALKVDFARNVLDNAEVRHD
jgi:hypothetical protein